MKAVIASSTPLLHADGAYIPAGWGIGSTELVTLRNGNLVPVPGCVRPNGLGDLVWYSSMTHRTLTASGSISFLSEGNTWKSTNQMFHQRSGFGAKHNNTSVIKSNDIRIPRTIPIFGSLSPSDDCMEALISGAMLSYGLSKKSLTYPFSYALSYLGKEPLTRFMHELLTDITKDLKPIKNTRKLDLKGPKSYPIHNVSVSDRQVFVHLMARYGIWLRKRYQSMGVSDIFSLRRLAVLLKHYKPKVIPLGEDDIPMRDIIWFIEPRPEVDTVLVEIDSDNICDGLFVWRTEAS